jgi:hypothetical protein
MNKRFVSLFMIVLILLGNSGFTYAFSGNPKIDWLIERGIVQGDNRGLRLYDGITRAEATKLIVEASGLGDRVPNFEGLKSMFIDMKDNWANGYVNVAVINSLVNGYQDKTFRPGNNISYAEVIKMLVMARGEKVDTVGFGGPYWFIPYRVKAEQMGITEGMFIPDFSANATRGMVFELVYNTIIKGMNKDVEIYKGIVVDNSRTSKLNDDEVNIVLFEDLNDSNAYPRYKMGEKIKVNIPKGLADTGGILGVVVDIHIDRNNMATEIESDKSYSYIEGPILASEYDVYMGANGKYYDVYQDKLQGVIHNDKSYDYDDFVYDLGDYDEYGDAAFLAEFARVTVKGSKVYFIDSYTFDDIAPVNNVRPSRNEVYIYDDKKDGRDATISLSSVIGYSHDSGFLSLDIDDIYPGDVIHIYNKNHAIARIDAENHGIFEDIIENQGFYFAQIDGDTYQVREANRRRPVFSLDGNKYYTLYADTAFEELHNLIDSDIIYLLDINDHVQSITKR